MTVQDQQAKQATQNSNTTQKASTLNENERTTSAPSAVKPIKPLKHGHGHGAMRMMVGEKPRDFKGTMRKILHLIGRFKFALVGAILFAIGSTAFNVVGPKVLSTATTELFNGIVAKIAGTGGINFSFIANVLIATLIIYVASSLCAFVQGWILAYVSQKTCYNLRQDIALKIDKLPIGYFEKASTGDTLSRITNDVDTLGQSLNQGLSELFRSVITIIGVLIIMFSMNVVMTLITLLIVPLSAIVIRFVVSHSQKYFYAQQERLGAIDGQIEETFSGHTVVKAFGRENAVIEIFDQTNEELYTSAWKSQFLSGLMRPLMDGVSNIGYVAIAIIGSFFAVQSLITVGDIQAFIQYVKNFTQPITSLAQVSNVLQSTAAAAERVFEFLEAPEEADDDSNLSESTSEGSTRTTKEIDIQTLTCNVEFDHVHFGYDPNKPVIKDFSAHIKEGQTVAFVGATGAGKTTLVKLLMRFYDVQGGAIRIGGVDIRDIDRENERKLFGMVLQDAWLFHGTVRDNIAYGCPDATDEQIYEAAREAYADHFIETLPGGYDCMINEEASNISAGQRQMISIARAFLVNRRMLVLDEATSSVDTRTEKHIQAAMDALMKGRTSFVIAHRLSTIRNADLILVIQEGDIVEQGTHDELLALNGHYAELYNSQFEL